MSGNPINQLGKAVDKAGNVAGEALMKAAKKGAAELGGAIYEGKKQIQDVVADVTHNVPSQDVLIVVFDDKSAELAGKRTALYARSKGYRAELMPAGEYRERRIEIFNNGNKVILIGHHDIVDVEKKEAKCKYNDFGMTYYVSETKCVLRAICKKLDSRSQSQFAVYCGYIISQYKDLAQECKEGMVPLRCIREGEGKDGSTLESRYDLLWLLFAARELPQFLEVDKKGPSHNGDIEKDAEQSGSDSPASYEDQKASIPDYGPLLKQFCQESPKSPYITQDYLRKFCADQQNFIRSPKICMENDWEVLLERDGWQVKWRVVRNQVCILDPDGKCEAAGTIKQILSPILNEIHAQARISAMKEANALEYGIVFEGGGARGAFQVGVWKWLKENGIAERFTAVSGASVGALNTLLFVQGDYEKAERVWNDMEDGDLVQLDPAGLLNFFSGKLNKLHGLRKKKLGSVVRENISLDALGDKLTYVSLSAYKKNDSYKVAAEIIQKLKKEFSMQSAKEALAKVSCLKYTFLDENVANPKETNTGKALASAAYPGAYVPIYVDGALCLDGGVQDNAPVYPLVKAGCREILVIHLNRKRKSFLDSLKRLSVNELNHVRFWHVWPQEELGDIFEISPDRTRQRIKAGYEAAAAQLKGFLKQSPAREKNLMLGAVIGNIVGSRFECHNHKSKRFKLFTWNCKFTDDTVMTLAIAKAFLQCKKDRSDLADQAIKCMRELGRKYPDVGYGSHFQQWLQAKHPQPYNSYGNGSAMRVSPCAYAADTLEEALKFAEITTAVSHNHPDAICGAKAVAGAVFIALHDADKAKIKKFVEENCYPMDFTLDEIRPKYRFDESCQGSVPQAIEAFLESTDFEDAIRNAVYIGGDSDTIAAIAGSIAAAYYGVPLGISTKALLYLDQTCEDILNRFGEVSAS